MTTNMCSVSQRQAVDRLVGRRFREVGGSGEVELQAPADGRCGVAVVYGPDRRQSPEDVRALETTQFKQEGRFDFNAPVSALTRTTQVDAFERNGVVTLEKRVQTRYGGVEKMLFRRPEEWSETISLDPAGTLHWRTGGDLAAGSAPLDLTFKQVP